MSVRDADIRQPFYQSVSQNDEQNACHTVILVDQDYHLVFNLNIQYFRQPLNQYVSQNDMQSACDTVFHLTETVITAVNYTN